MNGHVDGSGAPQQVECDVLINGAGPVGLALAILLRNQGVESIIITDRQAARYPLPRAVALHHDSRRVLEAAGLKEELAPLLEDVTGPKGTNFAWRDRDGEMLVELDMHLPSKSGGRVVMGFSQPELEGALEQAALDAGVKISRGIEMRTLSQTKEAVKATFVPWPSRDGQESTIIARYLVGCDGANSTTRTLTETAVTDLGFSEDWLVCDLLLKTGTFPDRVQKFHSGSQICDPTRPATIAMAGKGRKRMEFMRLPTETKEELYNPETAWRLLGEWGFTQEIVSMERLALYTFRARWADNWRAGRVLLAGDAAHQMPPFIGQGLNSGLRDAAALGWRIPLALKGDSSDALLSTYTSERLKHARALTEHCMMLGKVICELNPDVSAATHAALRANPPPHVFDPPLGQPGILTTQPFAGSLSLQRVLRDRSAPTAAPKLFDEIYGGGWRIISLGTTTQQPPLSAEARHFFEETLKGHCVALTEEDDLTGEYKEWFAGELEGSQAVIIRPDMVVYGAASRLDEVDGLVLTMKRQIMA